MGRIRSIKPDAFTSYSLSELPRGTRWTFAGLWTYLDDEGRGRADVRLIKAALYPIDDSTSLRDIEHDIKELVRVGSLCVYTIGDRSYLHCVHWEHQRINRPTASKLPLCPTHEASPDAHVRITDDSVSDHGGLTIGKGTGNREQGSDEDAPTRIDVEDICSTLAGLIEGNGSKRPTITKVWRTQARLLIDNDKRSVEDIKSLMRWCQSPGCFWAPNIQSMTKFREKYDTIRLQSERPQTTTAAVPKRSAATPEGW